jgi:hypothetical protein
MKDQPRTAVSEAELIEKVRRRLESIGCSDCVPTQLSPIKPVAGGVNWQVLANPPCSDPCQAMMLEACAALGEQFDVDWQGRAGSA